MTITVNGESWSIRIVPHDSPLLMRSDGTLSVAVTDDIRKEICVSESVSGAFLRKVICHELCHVFSFAHDLKIPIEVEEQIADFISVYGKDIVRIAYDIFDILSKFA